MGRTSLGALEKQIAKLYICLNCRRIMRLARHRNKCPSCGGTLKDYYVLKATSSRS